MVKNSPAKAGDLRDVGSFPGLRRSPGRGHGNLLQYSCLENPMDRENWQATVHGVAKSWTRLKRQCAKKKKKKCARMCEITNGEVVGERCYNLISQANTYQLLHITGGEGNGTPLQYSCLENPMDRGACGLQSMGSPRVRHN